MQPLLPQGRAHHAWFAACDEEQNRSNNARFKLATRASPFAQNGARHIISVHNNICNGSCGLQSTGGLQRALTQPVICHQHVTIEAMPLTDGPQHIKAFLPIRYPEIGCLCSARAPIQYRTIAASRDSPKAYHLWLRTSARALVPLIGSFFAAHDAAECSDTLSKRGLELAPPGSSWIQEAGRRLRRGICCCRLYSASQQSF